jgi:phenylacetate-CoA ligase
LRNVLFVDNIHGREIPIMKLKMFALKTALKNYIYRFLPLPNFYGRDFKQIFKFLLESSTWDREKIQLYKLERLKALVAHAEKSVPYYRELFRKENIDSRDINSFDDFSRLPILTKDILRNNLERLKAENFAEYHPIKTETSGSTGGVTSLYRSKYQESFRKAVLWRFYHQQDFRFRDLMFSITRPKYGDQDAPIYDHDRITNNVVINTDLIIHGKCMKIIPLFEKYYPKMIRAHPNTLCVLADHLIDTGRAPISIPIIAVYGEMTYPHVLRILKQAFQAKFLEYYGNRENSIAAWGYADGKLFEVSEYCHLEVEEQNSDLLDPGCGSIISTSLHNYAVPLIRYNSEDIGKSLGYLDNDIPYPAIEVTGGRGKDLLLSRDGLIVPYLPGYFEDSNTNKLRKHQIEQVSLDRVILRIVPLPEFDRAKDEPVLLDYYKKVTAGKFEIEIEYVDDIPFTDGGKYPVAISPFALRHLDRNAKIT